MISTRRRDTDVDTKQQDHEGAILGSSNAAPKGSCGGLRTSRGVGSRCARSSGRRLEFEACGVTGAPPNPGMLANGGKASDIKSDGC